MKKRLRELKEYVVKNHKNDTFVDPFVKAIKTIEELEVLVEYCAEKYELEKMDTIMNRVIISRLWESKVKPIMQKYASPRLPYIERTLLEQQAHTIQSALKINNLNKTSFRIDSKGIEVNIEGEIHYFETELCKETE